MGHHADIADVLGVGVADVQRHQVRAVDQVFQPRPAAGLLHAAGAVGDEKVRVGTDGRPLDIHHPYEADVLVFFVQGVHVLIGDPAVAHDHLFQMGEPGQHFLHPGAPVLHEDAAQVDLLVGGAHLSAQKIEGEHHVRVPQVLVQGVELPAVQTAAGEIHAPQVVKGVGALSDLLNGISVQPRLPGEGDLLIQRIELPPEDPHRPVEHDPREFPHQGPLLVVAQGGIGHGHPLHLGEHAQRLLQLPLSDGVTLQGEGGGVHGIVLSVEKDAPDGEGVRRLLCGEAGSLLRLLLPAGPQHPGQNKGGRRQRQERRGGAPPGDRIFHGAHPSLTIWLPSAATPLVPPGM